jgi:hypothetical protein
MAQVSGIEVNITGNSSGLDRALGKAEGAISRFSKTAMAGLAGALSVGAFVAAGKAAINYADSIDEMAEKVGIAAEELSALTYAAKVNGVSTEQLQTGLTMLIRSMGEGAEKFDALGVSIYDSNGQLRSANDVLVDVAEKFSVMEEGVGKSQWALELFGRSGLNLIPVLNLGSKGLAKATEEARLFGRVVSGETAKSAAKFNDNLVRLQSAFDGLILEAIGPIIPQLVQLTETLLELAKAGSPVRQFISNMSTWLDEWGPSLTNTKREIESITEALRYLGILAPKPVEIDIAGGDLPLGEDTRPEQKTKPPRIPGTGGGGDKEMEFSDNPSQEPGSFFTDRLEMIRDQFMSEREVLEEEYALNQAVLDNALMNKALKEQEYYDLSRQLAEQHASDLAAIQQASISQQLSDLGSGLGSMAAAFQNGGKKMLKVSKAFAAAQAIVATIQAAVDAMKNPLLVDPASKFAAYAAVFAKGMSAVAAIRGVSESGGGGRGGGGGSSGGRGGGGGMSGGGAPAAASPTTTFQFTMMNDPMGFGEKFARQFIDQLNSTQRNGGTIRGVIA